MRFSEPARCDFAYHMYMCRKRKCDSALYRELMWNEHTYNRRGIPRPSVFLFSRSSHSTALRCEIRLLLQIATLINLIDVRTKTITVYLSIPREIPFLELVRKGEAGCAISTRLVLDLDKIDSIYLLLLTENLKWGEINERTTTTSRNRRWLYAILCGAACNIDRKCTHARTHVAVHSCAFIGIIPTYWMDYGKSTFASKR